MNGQRYLTVIVAVCCIVGFGLSATAIESSLATHPDDVLDFDYQYLPFGEDAVQSIKLESWKHAGRQISPSKHQQTQLDPISNAKSNEGNAASPPPNTPTPTPPDTPTPTPPDTPTPTPTPSDNPTSTPTPPDTPTPTPPDTPTPTDATDGGGDGDGSGNGGGEGATATSTSPQGVGADIGYAEARCIGDGLLAPLVKVLPFKFDLCGLFPLLLFPLLIVLAAIVLGYRYRDRLFLPVPSRGGRDVAEPEPSEAPQPDDWPTESPENDVHQAWLTMVERANPERPWTRTTAECARAAIDAGMDSEAVQTITRLFEEVRYAGAPVTDERRQKAHDGIQRIEDPGGGTTHGHQD